MTAVEVRGDRARLRTDDSDATVIALAGLGAIRGLEVAPASLEDAFLALTCGRTVVRARLRQPHRQRSDTDLETVSMIDYLRLEVRRTLRDTGFVDLRRRDAGADVPAVHQPRRRATTAEWKTASMVGMAAYGALGSALSTGGGVAEDKTLGWLRQLRVTPLTPAPGGGWAGR